jgi:hypothetical protein
MCKARASVSSIVTAEYGVKQRTFEWNVIGADQLNEAIHRVGTWLSARFTRPVAIEIEVRYRLIVEESFSNRRDAFITETVLGQIEVINVRDLRTYRANQLRTRETTSV